MSILISGLDQYRATTRIAAVTSMNMILERGIKFGDDGG